MAGVNGGGESSLRLLKNRANRVFDESRKAMRTAVVLRVQCDILREHFRSHHGLVLMHRATPPQRPPGCPLTAREMMVLRLIIDGNTTKEIAAALNISFKTAATHRTSIMDKLDAPNTAAVVRDAFRLGLIKD